MTAKEYFDWLESEISIYTVVADNKGLDADVRSHAYGKKSALWDAKNKFLPLLQGSYRENAKADGFDDYCEAHGIPYNDECPQCKSNATN